MYNRFFIRVILIFIFISTIDYIINNQLTFRYRNSQTVEISLQLSTLRARIEKELTQNLLLVEGMANFISIRPELPRNEFIQYAQTVMAGKNLLKNIGAAPDFIMDYVFPIEGNEKIIGIDYRKLPAQWELVRKVQETGKMVVAGPIKLVQGGIGLVGRAPVIIRNHDQSHFWGIVSSVIDIDRLYKNAEIDKLDNLSISIRGIDGKGAEGGVFYGDTSLFDAGSEAVLMPVDFPSGSWLIAASPKNGWASSHPFSGLLHGGMAFLFLIVSFLTYKTMKKNHEILRARENLKEAQSIAHLGSWELDIRSNAMWWSDEVYNIFGVEKNNQHLSLENFFSFVHPEDKAMVEEKFIESVASHTTYMVDHRILLPDGSVKYVQKGGMNEYDIDGNHIRSSGTVLDITERKRAEEALAAEEKKMRAMLEASYDAYIMIDSNDTVLFWSPAAEKIFGWSQEEALGQKAHQLIVPDVYREEALRGFKRFSKTGKGIVINNINELQALHKDGSIIAVERSVAAFKSDGMFYAVSNVRDITQRKKAEKELQSYAERMSLASDAGGVGVWEWNLVTNEMMWDKRMYEIYGVRHEEFGGTYEAWRNRVFSDDLVNTEKELHMAMETNSEWRWEFRIVLPDGEIRHIQAAARPHKNEKGEMTRMIGISLDITEAKKAEFKLKQLATTDSLTGLFNRGHFMKLAQHEVKRSSRYSRPLSVIMFDADRFKNINDTYGHDIGDKVLRALAKSAQSALRQEDVIGRIGGEEFAVFLPETDLNRALQAAERLRKIVEDEYLPLDNKKITFTISIGVSELNDDMDGIETLLSMADKALYKAKASGRNRVEFM